MAFLTPDLVEKAFQISAQMQPTYRYKYGGPILSYQDGGDVDAEDPAGEDEYDSDMGYDTGPDLSTNLGDFDEGDLGGPGLSTPDAPETGGEGGDGTETAVERGRKAALEAFEAGKTGRVIGVDEITGYVDLVPGKDRPTGTASELSAYPTGSMTQGARATSNAELAEDAGITGAIPSATPGQSSVVQGDVNADGKVDELDAVAAGSSDYTQVQLPEQTLGQKAAGLAKAAADVNRDGVIDMKDAAISLGASVLTGGIAGPIIAGATAYDNVQTAKQYNTYPGSEQTRMLAAQDAEFASTPAPTSGGGGGGPSPVVEDPLEPEVPECQPGYRYNPLTEQCEYEGQATVAPAPIMPQFSQYAPPMVQYTQSPMFYPGTMVPQPQGGIMSLAPGTSVLGPQPMMGQIR